MTFDTCVYNRIGAISNCQFSCFIYKGTQLTFWLIFAFARVVLFLCFSWSKFIVSRSNKKRWEVSFFSFFWSVAKIELKFLRYCNRFKFVHVSLKQTKNLILRKEIWSWTKACSHGAMKKVGIYWSATCFFSKLVIDCKGLLASLLFKAPTPWCSLPPF